MFYSIARMHMPEADRSPPLDPTSITHPRDLVEFTIDKIRALAMLEEKVNDKVAYIFSVLGDVYQAILSSYSQSLSASSVLVSLVEPCECTLDLLDVVSCGITEVSAISRLTLSIDAWEILEMIVPISTYSVRSSRANVHAKLREILADEAKELGYYVMRLAAPDHPLYSALSYVGPTVERMRKGIMEEEAMNSNNGCSMIAFGKACVHLRSICVLWATDNTSADIDRNATFISSYQGWICKNLTYNLPSTRSTRNAAP